MCVLRTCDRHMVVAFEMNHKTIMPTIYVHNTRDIYIYHPTSTKSIPYLLHKIKWLPFSACWQTYIAISVQTDAILLTVGVSGVDLEGDIAAGINNTPSNPLAPILGWLEETFVKLLPCLHVSSGTKLVEPLVLTNMLVWLRVFHTRFADFMRFWSMFLQMILTTDCRVGRYFQPVIFSPFSFFFLFCCSFDFFVFSFLLTVSVTPKNNEARVV